MELCHVEKFPIEPGKIAVGLHKQESVIQKLQ